MTVAFNRKGNEIFKIKKKYTRIAKNEYMNKENFVMNSSSLQFLQTSL